MKQNKGIIGIGLIIAIVLGIIVVGGGAYYLGKSTDKRNTGVIIEENILSNNSDGDINNKEQVPSRGFATCTKDTTPWIILVSPNGGESYVLNQKVDVKWKSCNIPTGVDIGIDILNELKLNPLTVADNVALQQTPNDGIETISLSEQKDMQKFILGNKFKIRLNYVFTEKYTGPMPEGKIPQWAVYNDDSDNYFTINSGTKTISTALPTPYISSNQWPPVVKNSSTTYSCVSSTSGGQGEPSITIEQKIINSKTYCINSISDYGMNHWNNEYTYVVANGSGTKTISFSLVRGNCGVYGDSSNGGDAEYNKCQKAESNFNLDAIIDSLMFN